MNVGDSGIPWQSVSAILDAGPLGNRQGSFRNEASDFGAVCAD
jgi:hypothetical protein